MLLAMEALSAFQVLVNTLSVKSKAEISTIVSMWQDPFYLIIFKLLYTYVIITFYLFIYVTLSAKTGHVRTW